MRGLSQPMDAACPKLRPIEAFPVEIDGHPRVCLRDPLQLASDALLVAYPTYFILTLLDGERSVTDIQSAFVERFGTILVSAEIRDLIATLDQHHYLESPRFAAHRAEATQAFRAASLRSPAHAGSSYPNEADALRRHLGSFFVGTPTASASRGRVRGLVAPHIDLRVGGAAYGHAYATLRDTTAERFVILGTAHASGTTLFTATRKDFATPLGAVASDGGFLDALGRRYAGDLYADELLHRAEHSIEFQAVMLRYILGDRPFSIVPILVSSFHESIAHGRAPADDARVADFIGALRATIAEDGRPTVVVAGVDFAHVGEKFGDQEGLAPELLAATEAKDRRLIAALEAKDAAAFFAEIAADGDRTRVCGFAPMYTLLGVLDGVRGRLLHYDRTRDEPTRSSVSYASLAFDLK